MAQQQPTQFQRTLTALAASFLVFYLWVFVYQKFWAPPAPQTQPAGAAATQTAPQDAAGTFTPTSTQSAPATTGPSNLGHPAGGLVIVAGDSTAPVRLGDAADKSPFPMALELNPRGAAVNAAWLRGYYETVKKDKPYQVVAPLIENSHEASSLETPRVRFLDLNDAEVQLNTVVWKVDSVTDQQAVFSVQVNMADGTPLARIVKTYTLAPQPAKPGNLGETHDVLLTNTIENLTARPLRAVLVQQGPVGFRQAQIRQEDRSVIVAMLEKGREQAGPIAKAHMRSQFAAKESLELGRDEDTRRIAWVAEANQYFTCIMRPSGRVSADVPATFERVEAIHLNPNKDGKSEDLTFRYVTAPITVEAGRRAEIGFDCYIGPKAKKIFQSVPQYAQSNYYAVISSSFYFCAPTALVGVMMWLLDMFHHIPPHNYGIAIFLLVLVVRSILHPITKKSQVNMMKMQKQMATLQPKLAAAREKHGNDRAALNQATMEVYRDAGVNPAGSMLTCIPLMLQLPIWAALWAALNSMVEMRHAPLDGWWIKDLTQPDALIPLGGEYTVPIISYIMGGSIHAINLLPILLGISQLLQAKYMPRSNAPVNPDAPDQMEQQRKMMMFMSIFFFFMFYNMPSGLNLYIMTSNVTAIVEQWRIRQHIAAEEKKGSFAPPPSGPRRKSWLQIKWEQLQKEAEEARRIQGDSKKKR
jgi:YidC/Oxa1 family membrane protein insertase